ncbi:MAG TPA: hypothetical protein VEU62_02840 [Bryobacterales bacterium]|nr:hypothetical protein [Bryobacterales bacterium]
MPRPKKPFKKGQKPLDIVPGKSRRGRPGVLASEVRGRGDHYRLVFNQIWENVGEPLLKAQTEERVIQAFGSWPNFQREFSPIAGLVWKVLQDPKFPKRKQPQINFLADSLAARGTVSPRRSRDICEQEGKKKVNYIIRRDFYIECTCGYKGPASYGKCPKCGTGEVLLHGIDLLGGSAEEDMP